jgi:hypothetical protein
MAAKYDFDFFTKNRGKSVAGPYEVALDLPNVGDIRAEPPAPTAGPDGDVRLIAEVGRDFRALMWIDCKTGNPTNGPDHAPACVKFFPNGGLMSVEYMADGRPIDGPPGFSKVEFDKLGNCTNVVRLARRDSGRDVLDKHTDFAYGFPLFFVGIMIGAVPIIGITVLCVAFGVCLYFIVDIGDIARQIIASRELLLTEVERAKAAAKAADTK